jgi:hypothetical protein
VCVCVCIYIYIYGNRDLCREAMQKMGALQYAIKTLDKEDWSRDTSPAILEFRRYETEFLLKFLQLCNLEPAQVV